MLPLVVLSLCFWFNLATALRTITVDDQSPLIHYTSGWIPIEDSLDAGGGHMVTKSSSAEATITFTFRNMYFMSTRWHYHVGAIIVVDGQAGVADMQDYTAPPDLDTKRATIASSVVWSYKGDQTKSRTITVKVPPGDELTVLDMLVFEIDDEPPAPPPSTPTRGTTPNAPRVTTPAPSPPSPDPVPSSTFSTSPVFPTFPTSPSSTTTPSSPLPFTSQLPPTISSLSITPVPPSMSSLSSILPSPSSPSSSSSLIANTSHQLSDQAKALIISLSIVGAALLGLLIFLIYWFRVRKQSKQQQDMEKSPSQHDLPAVADGKPQSSPRASIGQASNTSSNDEEVIQPAPARKGIPTSASAMIPPPERRPTNPRPIPTNLHRNPTTVSVQHGLDFPRAAHSSQPDPHDAPNDSDLGMTSDDA